jgi:hypothetical protein
VYPHDGTSYDTLIASADRTMYHDKHDRKTAAQGRLAAG